jgi:hypothetical protein
LPDCLDTATVNLDSSERKFCEHKIKIIAVERGAIGYFGNRAIQHGGGDRSRQIVTLL